MTTKTDISQVGKSAHPRHRSWMAMGTVAILVASALGALGVGSTAAAAPGAGELVAWGNSADGRTAIPAELDGRIVTDISAGNDHALALLDDGTVVAWGGNAHGQATVPTEQFAGKTVTSVEAGSFISYATFAEGGAVSWGLNANGENNPGPVDGLSVDELSAHGHTLALVGTQIYAWGNPSNGKTVIPAELDSMAVTAVAAGGQHSLAVSDGAVWAWGLDASGQGSVPDELSGKTVIDVSAGQEHSVALLSDGTVVVWGHAATTNLPDELDGETVIQVSAGSYFTLALLDGGDVVVWGAGDHDITTIPAPLIEAEVGLIEAGSGHALAWVLAPADPTVTFTINGDAADGALATAGSDITVTGTGFDEGLAVTASFDGNAVDGTTTDDTGAFELTITIPVDAAIGSSPLASVTLDGVTHSVTVTIVDGIVSAVPLITGTTAVGQQLTATSPSWTAGTLFTYRWLRDGKSISGATAADYTLLAADKGKRISVRVTGSLPGHALVTRTSASTAKVIAGTLSAGTAGIAGSPTVGVALVANTGTWTPGTKFKYQWYLNGKAVSKATKSTWTVPASAVGKFVSVRVSASQKGYTSHAVLVQQVSTVALATFANAPVPVVSGIVQTGKTVSASTPAWSPKASFSYQWRVDGVPVPGATKSKWKIPTSAEGKTVTVQVTGSKSGYDTRRSFSAGHVVLGTLAAPVPKITGTAKLGEVLTAVSGNWPEATALSYQWYRASSSSGKLSPIVGATAETYVLGTNAGDKGKYFSVTITGQKAGYGDASVSSKRTGKVK